MLNDQQKEILKVYLHNFLEFKNVTNYGEKEGYLKFWDKRLEGIKQTKEIISNYLNNKISIKEFKESIDSLSRECPYWGFKGFSGQMQLNQYVNNINDSERENILKQSISKPETLDEAVNKINLLSDYLKKLKISSDNPKSIPRTNLSFFLSYFWEIQSKGLLPVYYGSSKKIFLDMGLMNDSYESAGEEYYTFVKIMEEIVSFFKEEKVDLGDNPFWFVEHVIWNKYVDNKTIESEIKKESKEESTKEIAEKEIEYKTNSLWVPPIIGDLEDLALNKETDWTKERNVKPEKAFETKLKYLFNILGYESEELGQGKGRQPDGVAISKGVEDGEYAIVYDAKAREINYSIGTQDREISEYIINKKQELKSQRVKKVYFLIVSSDFNQSPSSNQLLREIERKTQTHVTLMKASDLLFIVENKLKNSDLTHRHLEDLFLDTGLKTREQIIESLSNNIEL